MTTEEEKAQELFSLYRAMLSGIGLKSKVKDERAKECALVAVSEIKESIELYSDEACLSLYDSHGLPDIDKPTDWDKVSEVIKSF